MQISKTIFKQYTRCPRVCALDDLYMKRLNSQASIFGSDDQDDLIELLYTMFDEESGDDLIDVVDKQMEALLPYYNELEQHAMEIAQRKFGGSIHYSLKTSEQKLFAFDELRHRYYCYLDGYQEQDDINIFEVKATTSKKFKELGPKIKGVHFPLFTKQGRTYTLTSYPEMDSYRFAKSYDKLFDRYSNVGRYLFDMAVEKMIVEEARRKANLPPKPINYILVVLNSDYVFDGTYLNNKPHYLPTKDGDELVDFIDCTPIISQWQPKIQAMKQTLEQAIDALEAGAVPIGIFCERKKPSKCAFIRTCWSKALESGSILEYMESHLGFRDEWNVKHEVMDLINEGLYRLDSIPKRWLERPNNIIQRTCFEENKEYIDIDKVHYGIKQLVYPLYHLDFESFPSPLPRFRGEKPYAQSVFQYSLHIERAPLMCDKNNDHTEYVAPDFTDRREELVKQMIHDIDLSQGGTVIVYNKSFEHTRIKEFAILFPQYAAELSKINDHMFDLLDLVKTKSDLYQGLGFSEEESKRVNYYHNNLHGSYSIKKVLPIFSDLTYHGLPVANGTEAIAAYAKFSYLPAEDIAIIRRDLFEYCKQDTWAMVVVLWGLIKRSKLS